MIHQEHRVKIAKGIYIASLDDLKKKSKSNWCFAFKSGDEFIDQNVISNTETGYRQIQVTSNYHEKKYSVYWHKLKGRVNEPQIYVSIDNKYHDMMKGIVTLSELIFSHQVLYIVRKETEVQDGN